MNVSWTITSGDVTKSLSAWGISGATLVRRSLDEDELSFRIKREDVLGEPQFAYGADIVLRADGAVKFRGLITILPAVGSRHTESDQYIAYNAWRQLARTIYQQGRKVKSDDFLSFDTVDTTRVVLNQDQFGNKITTGTQIAQIVTYALTQGVLLVAGTTPAFVTAPLDECRDITCAEAIRRLMAITPDAVSWCEYTAGATIIHFQQRAALTSVEIDLGDADLVQEFSFGPRPELVPPGVVFIYVTTAVDPATDKTYTKITRDTAGLTSGVGVITATVEMMGAGTDHQETPPIGLAALYYASLQVVPYDGALVLKERDCGGLVRPGHKLNVAGGRAAWATMNALVQIVTEDLDRGVTTIEIGVPEHLSPQDFVNQIMFNRKVARPPEPTNFAAVKDNGTEEDPGEDSNPVAGEDPASYTGSQRTGGSSGSLQVKSLEICPDGQVKVYGPPD